MSIENLLTRYALNAEAAGFSQKTVSNTRQSVTAFSNFLGGIDDVRKVTADDLRRYLVALRNKTRWSGLPQGKNKKVLSGTAINTYARAIKAFWSWLAQEKIIDNNPMVGVKTPKLPEMLPKIYTESELIAVLKVARLRELAIVDLLLDTGIRQRILQPGHGRYH